MAAGVCGLAVAGSVEDSGAHGRSTSSSVWRIQPGLHPEAQVRVRVLVSDLQRAVVETQGLTADEIRNRPVASAAVNDYLTEHVALFGGGSRCAVRGPVTSVPSVDPSHLARRWRVRCAAAGPLVLNIDPFIEAVPSHFHLARAVIADGVVIERIFALDKSSFVLPKCGEDGSTGGASFREYVGLGIEHIATGVDHLLFLLALLLIGVSLREVATIVTGFTVAHSVTLTLGVLGWVEPRSAAIEALIGFSIAIVAIENFALTVGSTTRRRILTGTGAGLAGVTLAAAAGAVAVPVLALVGLGLFVLCYLGLVQRVDRPARLRWFVAFVFGLIHGFGFAGLLTEIGFPPGHMAPALLGFNLGVEVGQLVLVALVWPVLRVLQRLGSARYRRLVHLGSTPILAAGVYWFLSRSLG